LLLGGGPVLLGRHPGGSVKPTGELGERAKPGHFPHFAERDGKIGQQGLGPLDSQVEQELRRGQPRRRPEDPAKGRGTQPGGGSHLRQAHGFGDVRLDERFGPGHPERIIRLNMGPRLCEPNGGGLVIGTR